MPTFDTTMSNSSSNHQLTIYDLVKTLRKGPDHLSEQDVETKFSTLALAFKTDKFTLAKRLELHKRQRDIAEKNADDELKALRESLNALSQMCTDYQMRELITKIQHHVDVIQQSTLRVSSRAEMYGAVQEEQRMSNAFEVIVKHAENLKQLREKEHGELEEARRLLMDNQFLIEDRSVGDPLADDANFQRNLRSLSSCSNMSKSPQNRVRRASVAVISRTSCYEVGSSSNVWNGFVHNGNGLEQRGRVYSASSIIGSSAPSVGLNNYNHSAGRLYIKHNPLSPASSISSQAIKTRRYSVPVGPAFLCVSKASALPSSASPPITVTSGTGNETNSDNSDPEKHDGMITELTKSSHDNPSSMEEPEGQQRNTETQEEHDRRPSVDNKVFNTAETIHVPKMIEKKKIIMTNGTALKSRERRKKTFLEATGLNCRRWLAEATFHGNMMLREWNNTKASIKVLRVVFSVVVVMIAWLCLFSVVLARQS